jgi:hypothetical protein
MMRIVHVGFALFVTSICAGCFQGAQVRYVVDVKRPIDRKQPQKHARQDKDHPPVGKIRGEVPMKSD